MILCTFSEVNISTEPGIVPGVQKVLVNRLIHNHVTAVGRKYASAHQNKIPNKPGSCSVIPTHHFQSGLSHFVCLTNFFSKCRNKILVTTGEKIFHFADQTWMNSSEIIIGFCQTLSKLDTSIWWYETGNQSVQLY